MRRCGMALHDVDLTLLGDKCYVEGGGEMLWGVGGLVGNRSALMGAAPFPLLSCLKKTINENYEGCPKED